MELLTAIGTVLGIAAIQVFRDWRDGKHVIKKNGSYEAQNTMKKILEGQNELQHHFNHETTELLKEIRDNVRTLDSGMTAANTKLDVLTRK